VHEIGKRRNSPMIEWEHVKKNENIINEVIQYLDSLVTTVNPGFDMPIPKWHPYQKESKELCDDQQNYINLINKL